MTSKEIWLKLAELAKKGRCLRRQIGAFLVDKSGNVIGEGFNGTPMCMPSCHEQPCPDALIPAGAGVARHCYGIHAEERAILTMKTPVSEIYATYSTKAPCTNCVLKLLETSCQKIFFITPSNEATNEKLWTDAGREWTQLTPPERC